MAATSYQYLMVAFSGLTESSVDVTALIYEVGVSAVLVALDYVNADSTVVELFFKEQLSSLDKTKLDTIVSSHTGVPLPSDTAVPVRFSTTVPLTSDGRLRVAFEKSTSAKAQFYSHDWCDKTTWYEGAVRVLDETAVDSGDHTTYSLANKHVVDTYHGKITQEDFLKDSSGISFRAIVKVDGFTKVEQDPHYGVGGDYTIDYASGKISFVIPLVGTETIVVSYHYANTAMFTVEPSAGKYLVVEMVEVQVSDDVAMNDSIVFQAWGYVDVFAPSLLNTADPPGPYPTGTQIPLGNPLIYKSMRDIMNDAQRAYPPYPAMGGPSWRGLQRSSLILDWDYLRGTMLRSEWGMKVCVYLEHDTEFGGDFATATFYCSSEDE